MNHVIVTTLLDGPRHTVLHVFVKGDGTGDLDSFVIADPADFENMTNPQRFFTVETVQSELDGFSAHLKFDYLTDGTFVWVLPEYDSSADFITIGGLRDRSPELDGTGKVLMTTRNLSDGDVGSFVIKLRKE